MVNVNARNIVVRSVIMTALCAYTVFAAGPFAWVAIMSFRTTTEITANPYGLPSPFHWWKYPEAWFNSNYDTYFTNSLIVAAVSVAMISILGAMAAHCLARYKFPGNRLVFFLIFSTIILPPQITIIGVFQLLVEYGLYNSLFGLILVYVSLQLPLTVYILESFFARIPQDLFDAARMDGYGDFEIFWRISLPIGLPAVATTTILNLIFIWNEFLFAVVLLSDEDKRTLPLGIQRFLGENMEDTGMLATGLMIAIVPIIIVYVFLSEKMIQGMTAGAVK